MIDILLQIDFTNLTSPEIITEGLAFMIMTMLGSVSWLSVKLRSPAVFLMWALSTMVLILTFITGLAFVWFWVMILLTSIVAAVAASVQYLF